MTDPTHNSTHDASSSTAVARVKDKTEVARGAAADAARRTAQGIEANPLGILVGGLAVGVLAGTLIPRSAQEKELLAPLGKSLGTRARAAIDAAKETARTELSENGLTKNAAQAQLRGLVENLTKVAQNVASAAAKSATDRG